MSKLRYLNVESYNEMSKQAASIIINHVNENPKSILCMAGGDTPVGTYHELVEAQKSGKADFSQCTFLSLDEWVGLGENDLGSCRKYLNDYLFFPLGIKMENIVFYDAKSTDLEQECRHINQFLEENGPIDISLLGVGVNGHLGFNEPNTNIDNNTFVVDLDDSTKEVGKKYFNGEMNSTKGITLGLKQLLASKIVIVVASGETKKEAIKALKAGEYDASKPVTALNLHPNCFAILDIK